MKLGNMFKTALADTIPKKVTPVQDKPKVKDISKIHVDWPKVEPQQPKDYQVITTEEHLLQYLKRCEETGICGFDYETSASEEERERWKVTQAEYRAKIKIAGEDAKRVKQLESELQMKRREFLESPLDPWRAEICTVSLSACEHEARVIYISHKSGGRKFKTTAEWIDKYFKDMQNPKRNSFPDDSQLARYAVMSILDKHLFSNRKIMKIAVNLSFETKMTTKYGKYILSPVADPLIMWVRCLQVCAPEKIKDRKRPASGKGLKPMTKEIFGVQMDDFKSVLNKHQADFFDELSTDHPDTLNYSAEDADYAVQHYKYWLQVAKQIPRYDEWLHTIEMPFTRVIGLMEYHGMPWDQELASRKHEEAEIALQATVAEIEKIGRELFDINISAGKSGKTNDVKDLIFNKMKLPVAKRSETTGDPSLDKEALIDMIFMLENNLESLDEEEYLGVELPEGIGAGDSISTGIVSRRQLNAWMIKNRKPHPYKESGIKLLQLLQKIAKYSTLLSSHIIGREKYVNPVSGRIHSGYSQWTETGRLNSYSPNQQNCPSPANDEFGVRNFHCSPEGKVLLLADYSGFEMRLLTWASMDEVLVNIFEHDGDMHVVTACEVTGKTEELITKEERKHAKPVNFGKAYMISEHGLQKNYKTAWDIRKPLAECKRMLEAMDRAYPKVPQYQQDIVIEARETGYVETIYGYKRMLPNINSANKYLRGSDERRAANTPIQGSAADIMKRAQNDLYELIGEGTYRYKWEGVDSNFRHGKTDMIGQVHDEVILEISNDTFQVPVVATAVKSVMEKEPLPNFPVKIVADVEIAEFGWGDKIELEEWLEKKGCAE